LETGRDIYVDPDASRDEYLQRFSEHRETVRQICSGLGIDFYELAIDRPLELMLFDFLNARQRRGRQIRRRRPGAKGGGA
jgi:hypothetical protein